MYEYALSHKQSEAWQYLHDDVTTEVFFGGGAGVGKTEFGCHWEIVSAIKYPGTRGIICREQHTVIMRTTYKTFVGLLNRAGYKEGREYRWVGGSTSTFFWANGSETIFQHAQFKQKDPDFNWLGGTEVSRVFIDESPEVHERAASMLSSRIRHMLVEYGLKAKMLLTGNPGEHWVKYAFVFDTNNKPVKLPEHRKVVLGTILDNPNEDFRREYKEQLQRLPDQYDIDRLLHGDWLAVRAAGSMWWIGFKTNQHVMELGYDPTLPIHCTFDFNWMPYITGLMAQVRNTNDVYHVHFFHEYCLVDPESTSMALSRKIAFDLEEGRWAGHDQGIFIYGDYSGLNRTTMATEDVENDFDQIGLELQPWMHNHSMRVDVNPSQIKARDFCCHIMRGELPLWVTFEPNMANMLRDVRNAQQDANGKLLKKKVKDPTTKIVYEEYGHCTQAAYYLLVDAFRPIFDNMKEHVRHHMLQKKYGNEETK